jgi:predicted permease
VIAYLDVFIPAFGLLALGAALRRFLLRDVAVWAGIERVVFWALTPALLLSSIASVDLAALPLGRMAVVIWLALLGGTVLSLLLARTARLDHPATTSVLQGGIRFNNLMGFALTGGLYGAPGTALGAVATGLIVPFVQFVTNAAFALGRPGPFQPWPALRQIALNPVMLACVAGFAVAWLGGLPAGIKPMAEALGRASVALGLLAVGAALSPGAMRDRVALQLATAALKLLLMPALTLALCLALGLDPLPTAMAVLFMALPTAATSYVMARAMGGDAPLMAAITSSEHALAILTLPLWLTLVRHLTGLG